MALKTYKPVTPGQRQLVLVDRSGLHKGGPVKALTEDPGKYRYIVCDFAMPGLDGLQTLRKLRGVSAMASSMPESKYHSSNACALSIKFLVPC